MKFIALLRCQTKVIVGAALTQLGLLLGIGYYCIAIATELDRTSNIYGYTFSPLTYTGPLLIIASLICGGILGLQFWINDYTKTWYFLLHRCATRTMILLSMITAAIFSLIIFTGGCWTLLFLYASVPGLFLLPPTPRVYIEGWLFISLGLVFFLGVSLSGISTAKFYTTKLFGIIFAGIVLITTFMSLDIVWGGVIIAAGILFLAVQLFSVFLNREF